MLAVGVDVGAGAVGVVPEAPGAGALCAPLPEPSVLAGVAVPLPVAPVDGLALLLGGALVEEGAELPLGAVPLDEGADDPVVDVSVVEGLELVPGELLVEEGADEPFPDVSVEEGAGLVLVCVLPLGAAHPGYPDTVPDPVSAAAMLGSGVVSAAIVAAIAVHRCGAVISFLSPNAARLLTHPAVGCPADMRSAQAGLLERIASRTDRAVSLS